MCTENESEKITKAVEIISYYGGIDAGHHKQWVIDQVLKVLLGDDTYSKWLMAYCNGEDGPDTYEWDTGIAPFISMDSKPPLSLVLGGKNGSRKMGMHGMRRQKCSVPHRNIL